MDERKPLVLEYKDLVHLLSQVSPKLRRQILQSLNKREVSCISEIFSNFLKKRLTHDSAVINKLKKFRNDIRTVALKKTPVYRKKAVLLSKRGGSILAALLPIAVSLITSLLQK